MVADCVEARAVNAQPKLVFSVNGNSIARAATDAVPHAYEAADLIHADGQPVVLASQLLTDTPIPERSATTDFFHDAAKAAARHGLSFYLLGGSESVNARCAAKLQRLYPGLRIAGPPQRLFRARETKPRSAKRSTPRRRYRLGRPRRSAGTIILRAQQRAAESGLARHLRRLLQFRHRRLCARAGLDAGAGLEWLYRRAARAAASVLALCAHQSARALLILDAQPRGDTP